MAKMFGKKITTEEQVNLYNEYKALSERRKQVTEEHREKLTVYWEMEGMYSTGKEFDEFADMHDRGYFYRYADSSIKAKEEEERKLYHKENVEPLSKEIDEINAKLWATEKALCVALWGYGPNVYRLKHELIAAEKELKEQMAYIERLKKELAELEEEA